MKRITMFRVALAAAAACVLDQGLPAQTVYPTGTTIHEPGTNDGYTMFVAGDGVVYLIDMDGTVVNTWTSPIPGEGLSSVEPLSNGRILAFSGTRGQPTTKIAELDYDGQVQWAHFLPAAAPPGAEFHHDIERLPNGNTLILCSQPITVPAISPVELIDDLIIEVTPSRKIVWAWFTYQHFEAFGFDSDARELIYAQGGDWAHANSISVIPPNSHVDPAFTPGNIIVSQRRTNTVFIIDKQTKAIVWRTGPEPHLTFGQHYPHMISQDRTGAGNILVFDNGSGVGYPLRKPAPGYSTVIELDPVSMTQPWTYNANASGLPIFTFFSNIVSGAERLENGNTLICSGVRGRLFEVSPSGDILWEYMSPFTGSQGGSERRTVFRAYRLPYSWAPR